MTAVLCACASASRTPVRKALPPTTFVAELMSRSRADTAPLEFFKILTPKDSVGDARVREELLDSLEQFMMTVREDTGRVTLAIYTRGAFLMAAAGDLSVPYPNLPERLLRLATGARSMFVRGEAITDISYSRDKKQARKWLREILMSQNPAASSAVPALEFLQPPPTGLLVLQDLYESGSVTELRAKAALDLAARRHGWQARKK